MSEQQKPLTKEEVKGCYIELNDEAILAIKNLGYSEWGGIQRGDKFLVSDKDSDEFEYVTLADVDGFNEPLEQIYLHKGSFYAEPYREQKAEKSGLTKKQQYDIASVINSLGALMFFEETTIEVAAQLGRSIVVLEKLMDEEE